MNAAFKLLPETSYKLICNQKWRMYLNEVYEIAAF